MTESAKGPSPGIFERDLPRRAANWAPLTPLDFLTRAAEVEPEKTAVVHGARRFGYGELQARCRRLAAALKRRGIERGEVVAVMAPNVPALLEAHYGVPMIGAILLALNTRQDAATLSYILEHSGAKAVITDRELSREMKTALGRLAERPLVIDIDEVDEGERLGVLDYEAFLGEGDPEFVGEDPLDEWQSLSLLYTSGTTGKPKGVLYHHRGAHLNAIGNMLTFGLDPSSVYLWTLPMFHCNGWTYTWAVTAARATHVCLRKLDPARVFDLIREEGITHLCGAPVVLNLLAHAPESEGLRLPRRVEVATGGAAPPSPIIAAMERIGFRVTHLYGLTETYGPAALCAWQEGWEELPLEARAALMARQGVNYLTLEGIRVVDPESGQEVPADGMSLGELQLRGNTVMKGYLNDPGATETALADGWFRSGDLAVVHPDGYVEIKDRSKDVIISGGENVSSLEVEEILYRHPGVLEAAVVARPDEKWGETPCAFVTMKSGASGDAAEIRAFCRESLAGFKVPKTVVFGPLPKTSTGKIQKYLLRERALALAAEGKGET